MNMIRERSRKATDARVTKMRERDQFIKKLREEVIDELAQISKHPKYSELIKYLIVQGLMTIAENRVILQCRKDDMNIVKSQIEPAIKLYQATILEKTEVTPKCQIEISNEHLPPAPVKGTKSVSCCGGIVLSARNGTIVCKNTLDSRLDLCFENLIPQIRGMLFGVRDRPLVKETKENHH